MHLRVLRCANNQLTDITAFCQFPLLEELYVEGNPFLTVCRGEKPPGGTPPPTSPYPPTPG